MFLMPNEHFFSYIMARTSYFRWDDDVLCALDQHAYYPLANEVAKGYSNATFRNILVNTLESTSSMDFDQTWYILSP
jgi:hypothetical protein